MMFSDFLVPPVFTHAPVDAVFEHYIPYEYVYFRCDAYGIPEPEIYWKKVVVSTSSGFI